MCEDPQFLVFCTCAEGELEEPDWRLQRHDPSLPENHKVGKLAWPQWASEETAWEDTMLEALQAQDRFDFPYTPREGDVFSVAYRVPVVEQKRWYRYRFLDGAWQIDDSTKFASWRTQMVEDATGWSKVEMDLPTMRACLAEEKFLLVWQAIPWFRPEQRDYALAHIPKALQKSFASTSPHPPTKLTLRKPVKPQPQKPFPEKPKPPL